MSFEWEPLPLKQHVDGITSQDAASLLRETEDAIRGNLQARAAALVHRYGQLGHSERPMFDLMLKYAVSEDGSLHAEKWCAKNSPPRVPPSAGASSPRWPA